MQIDVEDREIIALAFCKRSRFIYASRLGDDSVPQFLNHRDKHHSNERFIFDKEYRCLRHDLPQSLLEPATESPLRS
ncbi:hypothetical protein BJS_00007 [Bradyrhizobium japonicum SEMIA 5079]|nr:hypothetical protein BJS_00007 [Bradyrhizobium japonicum SEMIA 5079]